MRPGPSCCGPQDVWLALRLRDPPSRGSGPHRLCAARASQRVHDSANGWKHRARVVPGRDVSRESSAAHACNYIVTFTRECLSATLAQACLVRGTTLARECLERADSGRVRTTQAWNQSSVGFGVWGLGLAVYGFGIGGWRFMVSGLGVGGLWFGVWGWRKTLEHLGDVDKLEDVGRHRHQRPHLHASSGYQDSGFGYRVSGLGFRVSGSEVRRDRHQRHHLDPGFRCRVSASGSWTSSFGFRVLGFGFQGSGFGFRESGLEFRISG